VIGTHIYSRANHEYYICILFLIDSDSALLFIFVLILTFHFVCVFVLVEFGEMEQEQSSVEMFDKFTWKIENFSRLKTDMIYSEPFVIGGYPWYDFFF
jgi:hypothetical protein